MQKNKNILIFGGTFDPIHFGHLNTVESVVDLLQPHEVIWLPAGIPPHKSQPVADKFHRNAMLNLALKNYSKFKIDSREIDRDGPSFSIFSLSEIKSEQPDSSMCLLLGLDSALSLSKWYKWKAILEIVNIAVMLRPGWSLPKILPSWWKKMMSEHDSIFSENSSGHIAVIDVPEMDISASEIRADFSAGRSISNKMPKAIAQYIEENKLYV